MLTNNTHAGWVYIMENVDRPGIIKIGRTSRTPELRAKEISKEDGIYRGRYKVTKAWRVINPRKAEKLLHKEFHAYRIPGTENFKYKARPAAARAYILLKSHVPLSERIYGFLGASIFLITISVVLAAVLVVSFAYIFIIMKVIFS